MIRTYLGRVCRDLVRKTGGDAELRAIFAQPCRSPGRPAEGQLPHCYAELQFGEGVGPSGDFRRLLRFA